MKPYLFLSALCCTTLLVNPAHGQTFTNERITTDDDDQSEAAIAISPLSTSLQLVAWNDFSDHNQSQPGYAFSTDTGDSWTLGIVPDITDPEPDLIRGFDPSVGFGRNGYAYYCYAAMSGIDRSQARIYVSRSDDLGSSWEHATVSEATTQQDKPTMVIDNTGDPDTDGRIYVAWVDANGANEILFAYSEDGGENFIQLSEPLATGGTEPENVHGPIPAVAINGDVYVIWTRAEDIAENGTPCVIEMARSTDGGETFDLLPDVASFNGVSPGANYQNTIGFQVVASWLHASIGTDPMNHEGVYVTYTDYNQNNWIGMCASTTDAGENWNYVESSTLPSGVSPGKRYFQSLAVYPTGKLSIVFYHTIDAENVYTRVAESDNNGASFTPLSDPLATTFPASQGNWSYDYIGQASASQYTFPVWVKHVADPTIFDVDIYWACINRSNTSSLSYATSSASGGRKTSYTTSDSRWHSVFQTNGKISYTSSTSDGVYWTVGAESVNGSIVLNEQSSPALGMSGTNPKVVFGSLSGLYFNRSIDGEWLSEPVELEDLNAESPSLVVETNETTGSTGHVVWVYNPSVQTGGPAQYKVLYATFSTEAANPTLSNLVSLSVSNNPLSKPAIILDSNQKPHVVWEGSGEIYYRNKTGSIWSVTENLSTNSNAALNPTIVSYSTTIYAAWQENVSGNNEIYYKVRTGSSWGYYTNASQTSGSSVNPVLGVHSSQHL